MADNGKQAVYYGIVTVVPNNGAKQTITYYQSKGQSCYGQTIITMKTCDKKTGSYARATNREAYSSGETFKERSTGRNGYKDEYKTTNTYRVGDKSGYTEYQVEERFRNVTYGGGIRKQTTEWNNSSSPGRYTRRQVA